MGIALNILLVFLHLMCIGIDVAIFFLLLRFVSMWRRVSWLEQLNEVGRPLVDAIVAKIGRLWYRTVQKQLSCRGVLLVSLTAFLLLRQVISGVGHLF
jgi:hypothetical protein